MNSPSYGARGRHRPTLHLASSQDKREAGGRYPYRSALADMKLPRTERGRANRRDWWLCWVIIPALMVLGCVVLVASTWRHP